MSTYAPHVAESFTQLLARREAQLRQALAALGTDNEPASTQEVSDFKDVAVRHVDAEVDDLQAARLVHSLQRVAAARARLVAGQYGTCQDCGEAIDLRRLQALPEADLCLNCQGAHEQSLH